jgi:hypothetical protein
MRVLEAGGSRREPKKLPSLLPDIIDRVDFQRLNSAPAVQLIARDSFVADMAIKLDQLQLEIKALGREFELSRAKVAELRDDTERSYRFSSFQDSQQRTNAAKMDDILRRCNDLKLRLDSIDGKSGGDYHAYNSFQQVSVRLTQLSSLQREFRDVERKLKLSAGLFCGSVLLWLFALLS